ncbi:RNA polymerase Rpb4-domain-containing protein [Tricladium varicosporioides]|nr:RNA polymerase Rpb4-domain-containing protein [Hymenoscyphus varicosporioides]
MKILEAQAATLTNYEVYTHLQEQKIRHAEVKLEEERKHREKKAKLIAKAKEAGKEIPYLRGPGHDGEGNSSRRPGNLNTMRKEVLDYLGEAPSPLGSDPFPYNERTISNLLKALRSWDITKGEMIMILNLRPTKPENLHVVVQQIEDRFSEEDQNRILKAISNVLGQPDGEAEREAVNENAKEARKWERVKEGNLVEGMDVDE